MADALNTITKLINSPPGQLAAGGVLAGIVWKFFERVEAVLTDQTKLEVAVWLVGRKPLGAKIGPWPDTFSRLLNTLFGTRHISWKCFWRSCVCSAAIFIIVVVYQTTVYWHEIGFLKELFRATLRNLIMFALPVMAVSDYLFLLKSRFLLALMQGRRSGLRQSAILLADTGCTAILSWLTVFWSVGLPLALASTGRVDLAVQTLTSDSVSFRGALSDPLFRAFIYPAFFTSIWLWLYAGSGFLLKAARRFDIGFEWFNRKFDIEKKPLQSIGLVAGALVAMVYWMVVVIGHLV